MRGLIGDRFLKQFFGDLSRRRRINPANEVGPVPENREEKANESDCRPRENVPGKEEPQNIEKTDVITKPIDQKDGLDRSSGVTQLPDEHKQTE